MTADVVIVGAGHGGPKAGFGVRQHGVADPITLIDDEAAPPC